jgi:hypothetical protein
MTIGNWEWGRYTSYRGCNLKQIYRMYSYEPEVPEELPVEEL